jgi:DNA-directed RNA polymerase subunit RPC12/RpoP
VLDGVLYQDETRSSDGVYTREMSVYRKHPSGYSFACFTCCKAFKKTSDGGDHVIVCPECSRPMVFTGSAFRAPKQDNVDQWKKAELLIEAGFMFTPGSGPKPRTLKDVPAFLEVHRKAHQSAGERLLEQIDQRASGGSTPITRAKQQGRVKRVNLEGRPRFELVGRELKSWSRVLVNVDGQWQAGTFRFTGHGGKTVEPHVELKGSEKRVFISENTVLRWPN